MAEQICGARQAVQEAVQEAVQAARDEGIKFDVRANLYTLLAISGAHMAMLTHCWRVKEGMRPYQTTLHPLVKYHADPVASTIVMHALQPGGRCYAGDVLT